jgi:hypothetical protein
MTLNVVVAHPLATGSAAVGDRDAAWAGYDDGESVEAHVAHAPCPVSVHAPRQRSLTKKYRKKERKNIYLSSSRYNSLL